MLEPHGPEKAAIPTHPLVHIVLSPASLIVNLLGLSNDSQFIATVPEKLL
jgi:hypothetical protein